MIELLTLKAACNTVLRAAFPTMKIYGPDSLEGLDRPSFYTEIVPYILEYQTTNLVHLRVGYKVSLMEEAPDEERQLTIFAKIRKAFGLKLPVGKRRLSVREVSSDYTGEKNDVFQTTVVIDWIDTIAQEESYDLMLDIDVETELKGD